VTLVMPVWRPRRDWLLQAVRSALAQRDCRLELVVVDDGNPEPVAELLADVRHPGLRVLRVPHRGVCLARNAGIEAARGSLIRFVDADDVYEPGSTARLARLVDDDAVIAYGGTVFCDQHLRPVWTMASRREGRLALDAVLGRFQVRIQSLLFPAAVVQLTGPWDPSFPVCHDLDFIVRALEHARARPDAGVATYYRKHGDSVSSDIVRGDDDVRRVIERYFERHPEQRGTAVERRAMAWRHAVAARAHSSRGRPRPALRRFAQSLALDPRGAASEARVALPALGGHLAHAAGRLLGRSRRAAGDPTAGQRAGGRR
jgi:glycosyltransferase involved in cell wall biosynthesis